MNWSEILSVLVCYLGVLLLAIVPLAVMAVARRSIRFGPPRPVPSAPFPLTGLAVLFAGLFFLLAPMVVHSLRHPDSMKPGVHAEEAKPSEGMDARESVGVMLLAFPLQLVLYGFLQNRFLTPAGYGVEASCRLYPAAVWTWAATVPIVFAIHHLSVMFMPDGSTHALMKAFQEAPTPLRIVIACQAVLFSPLIEEWLFRGIILRWQEFHARQARAEDRWDYTPFIVFAIAAQFVVVQRLQASAFAFILAIFLMLLAAELRRMRRGGGGIRLCDNYPGIIANSALFASVHASVWPSPIPLFFLSLALGWLAVRYQSFWPAFVVHALFNGISTAGLFWSSTIPAG